MDMTWLVQFRQYITDVKSEINKIVWPSRKETMTTTLIVFAMIGVMSIFLWLVDALLATLVHIIVK